jgi:hypothetical protein
MLLLLLLLLVVLLQGGALQPAGTNSVAAVPGHAPNPAGRPYRVSWGAAHLHGLHDHPGGLLRLQRHAGSDLPGCRGCPQGGGHWG